MEEIKNYKLKLDGYIGIKEYKDLESLLKSLSNLIDKSNNEELRFTLFKEVKKVEKIIIKSKEKLSILVLKLLKNKKLTLNDLYIEICIENHYNFKITAIQRELYRLKDKGLIKKFNRTHWTCLK
jgi:hypothetical protein